MSPENNDGPMSPSSPGGPGPAPDITSRFQAGLRDSRTKAACPNCRWIGSNLAKHAAEEHGENLTDQQIAAATTVAEEKPAASAASSLPQTSGLDDSMQIDESPATPAPATTPSRPSRRKQASGPGRRVESGPVDPEYARGPRGRGGSTSTSQRLYDPRSDSIKPLSQSSRPTQPQRVPAAQQQTPSSPRNSPRVSRGMATTSASTQPNPVVLKKQPVSSSVAAPPASNLSSIPAAPASPDDDEPESQSQPELILQPETRPISQEQLVAEVKGIYAGLVMVEAKCIEVDSKQAAAATQGLKEAPRLNNDQWQALIALHRTLLHEHHDFFLASQHPSAAPSLRKLATKYAMPARMWRHGIHSFLELLRHRLPDSFEHMLAFIYLAYSMMALLYETVPAFADTWVECLGDLGRYRMAIEEGDPRDREVWMHVSRFWYAKGTDRQPHVGRLYHHLAILARPNILQQLFFYCKALAVSQPFSAARESILTLFDPTALKEQDLEGAQSADSVFVLLHSICFTAVNQDAFAEKKDEYLDLLDKKISAAKLKFKVPGVYIAVCGVASLFQYNIKEGRMKTATSAKENSKATSDAEAAYKTAQQQLSEPNHHLPPGPVVDGYEPKNALQIIPPELDTSLSTDISLDHAQELAFDILSLCFDRGNDAAVQPHIHVWLVLLDYLKHYPEGMALIVKSFPWERMAQYGTALMRRKNDEATLQRIQDSEVFPVMQKGFRPLPEEYMMRGLEIARRYFPWGYFNKMVDDDERLIELPSMSTVREEKMLWLMVKFANYGPWIRYDPARLSFSVSPELKSLLQSYNSQPTYMHEPISVMDDDSDIEMDMSTPTLADEEDESFDEMENPELTQLLAQRNALRKQLNEPSMTSEQQKSANKSGSFSSDMFKAGETVVVVDTNSLVKYLDTFKRLLEGNQWSIVIPYSVITELRGLQRNEKKVAETSELALNLLNQALNDKEKRSKLRIVTAKQSPITSLSGQFYELIDDYNSEEGRKNLDDIIIETAKIQGEISAKRLSLGSGNTDSGVRPVVLITDDAVMRLKANTRGVAAVGTKQFIKYIFPPAPADEDTQRKIAITYHMLMTKNPTLNQDRVYKAAQEARGDESSAANILKRDTMMKKKRAARAHMERQRQHGLIG